MNNLRKYIRHVLVEAGEKREAEESKKSVDLKTWFNANADQNSLKTLEYYHFCTTRDAEKLLKCCVGNINRDEINAIAIKRNEEIPHFWTYNPSTIAFRIQPSWVSFLSKKDVYSGFQYEKSNRNQRGSGTRKYVGKDQQITKDDLVLNANMLPSAEYQSASMQNRSEGKNWTEAHLARWKITGIHITDFMNRPADETFGWSLKDWVARENKYDLPVFDKNRNAVKWK